MKGLQKIPGESQLVSAYETLQLQSFSIREELIALWSQWVRFDPRLGEMLVSYLANHWKTLSPLVLNHAISSQPWPAALGVLLEQVGLFFPVEQPLYRDWKDCALSNVQADFGSQFYIGLRGFASPLMRLDVELSIQPYLRWGFFGREILLNKASANQPMRQRITLLAKDARLEAIDRLLVQVECITVELYRDSVNGNVSMRQAERDLKTHPRLRAVGNTRGRFYRLKKSRRA